MPEDTPRTFRKMARFPGNRDRRTEPPGLPTASRPMAPNQRPASAIDSAIYVGGNRIASPTTLNESYSTLRSHTNAVAWIALATPSQEALKSLAAEFGLHELSIEDAILAHQRPKLERYGHTLFVVLRSAWYLDTTEEVDFGELHVFVGQDFVVTVRHGEHPDLAAVRVRMEDDPELLRLGPEAVLYAILDRIVDGYAPVVAGLSNDIEEIETQVFAGDTAASRRIYDLNREVIEFQRAARPLIQIVRSLTGGFEKYHTDEELQRYLRDVEDHLILVVEQISEFRGLLRNILSVNATLVAQQQNDEMKRLSELGLQQNDEVKKISSWAAILFAPTLVGTVYGMNFDTMPELHWRFGYYFALGAMVLGGVVLYAIFRHKRWL